MALISCWWRIRPRLSILALITTVETVAICVRYCLKREVGWVVLTEYAYVCVHINTGIGDMCSRVGITLCLLKALDPGLQIVNICIILGMTETEPKIGSMFFPHKESYRIIIKI